jgi:hypothetical protein
MVTTANKNVISPLAYSGLAMSRSTPLSTPKTAAAMRPITLTTIRSAKTTIGLRKPGRTVPQEKSKIKLIFTRVSLLKSIGPIRNSEAVRTRSSLKNVSPVSSARFQQAPGPLAGHCLVIKLHLLRNRARRLRHRTNRRKPSEFQPRLHRLADYLLYRRGRAISSLSEEAQSRSVFNKAAHIFWLYLRIVRRWFRRPSARAHSQWRM